jgi:hypothetical protein
MNASFGQVLHILFNKKHGLSPALMVVVPFGFRHKFYILNHMAKHKIKQATLHFDTIGCGVKMMNHFESEMVKTIQKALETRAQLQAKYGKYIVQLF